MFIPLLPILTLLTAFVIAGDVRQSSGDIPDDWEKGGATPSDTPFNFTLHLAGADMAGLSTKMEQIAIEGKGRWLTEEQLRVYITPTAAAIKAVDDFLMASGIPAASISKNKYKDQVTVRSTVGQINKLFLAAMTDYNADRVHVSRTISYTIPSSISDYVQDVSPIAMFGHIEASGRLAEETVLHERIIQDDHHKRDMVIDIAKPLSCNMSSVTPQCRKDYYGTASYKRGTGGSRADVAVMGFNDMIVDDENLNIWYKMYAPEAQGYKVKIESFNGALKSGFATFEALLNTETVVGEIYPLTTTFLSMAPRSYRGDPWLLAFNTLLEQYTDTTRPKVITISYAGDERHFSPSQARMGCEAAQKLNALGMAIVVSSGDFGIAGTGFEKCTPFVPRYPNGCPFILSAGGTFGFTEERPMAPDYGGLGAMSSGAGASNIFPMPAYQFEKVKAYQNIIGPLEGAYNLSSRFYPDLSAQSSQYAIRWRGKTTVSSGTSASAPYIASLIALINEKRQKVGLGQVGWPHYQLYRSTLKDITVGGVYGCTDSKLGFPSAKRFGAAGLGTPMFDLLSKAFGVE